MLRLAVFVSGNGTTLEALAGAVADGTLPASIVTVVADRPQAMAVARARRRGLDVSVVAVRGRDPGSWADEVTAVLSSRGVELVVLAGFLSILPPHFVRAWRGRIINVHPSLLPKYGGPGMFGERVFAAVLADRETETGASVHLVTDQVDGGPVLAQGRIRVEAADTPASLRERTHPVEVHLLLEVLGRFAAGAWPLPYAPAPSGAARGSLR